MKIQKWASKRVADYAFKQGELRKNQNSNKVMLLRKKELMRSDRPWSTYSLPREGRKISDEQIKEYLTELVCGEGFPYGYRKLTVCLREDYVLL